MNWMIDGLYAVDFANLNERESSQILQMRNHKNITKWMLVDRTISKEEHHRFIEGLKGQANMAYFALKDSRDSDDFLGVISLVNIDLYNKNAFLGIYANPAMKNVGTTLMRILTHIAFVEFGLHVLFAKVLQDNDRALRFYSKCGFARCGILPQAIWRDSAFSDIILLSLINPDEV